MKATQLKKAFWDKLTVTNGKKVIRAEEEIKTISGITTKAVMIDRGVGLKIHVFWSLLREEHPTYPNSFTPKQIAVHTVIHSLIKDTGLKVPEDSDEEMEEQPQPKSKTGMELPETEENDQTAQAQKDVAAGGLDQVNPHALGGQFKRFSASVVVLYTRSGGSDGSQLSELTLQDIPLCKDTVTKVVTTKVKDLALAYAGKMKQGIESSGAADYYAEVPAAIPSMAEGPVHGLLFNATPPPPLVKNATAEDQETIPDGPEALETAVLPLTTGNIVLSIHRHDVQLKESQEGDSLVYGIRLYVKRVESEALRTARKKARQTEEKAAAASVGLGWMRAVFHSHEGYLALEAYKEGESKKPSATFGEMCKMAGLRKAIAHEWKTASTLQNIEWTDPALSTIEVKSVPNKILAYNTRYPGPSAISFPDNTHLSDFYGRKHNWVTSLNTFERHKNTILKMPGGKAMVRQWREEGMWYTNSSDEDTEHKFGPGGWATKLKDLINQSGGTFETE